MAIISAGATQKLIFIAICIVRFPLAEVITPNVPGEFTARPGVPQVGWLKKLNASARICVSNRSRSRKCLKNEKSMFTVPGARRSGENRDVFPKAQLPTTEKTDGSKYAFNR